MAKGFFPDEGGHQTYARDAALAYARLGADVTVFTQSSAGPRHERFGPVDLVDFGRTRSPTILLRWVRALRRRAQTHGRPDFLHATTWRTSVPPLLAGFEFATTFHGREFMYARWPVKWVLSRIARRAHPAVAVSRYTADRLMAKIKDHSVAPIIAWNGTSLTPLPRHEAAVPRIMTLCRLEPRKNLLAAVRAAARVKAAGHRFTYVICGRGPQAKELADLISALALQDCVTLAGFVNDDEARRQYATADIFLHPQIACDAGRDFEGFGIAVADAMLAGAAVIVGAEGGTAELVEHGISGMIVKGRDDGAIADALTQLLSHPERRHAIALAAIESASALMTADRHVGRVLDAAGL